MESDGIKGVAVAGVSVGGRGGSVEGAGGRIREKNVGTRRVLICSTYQAL